MELGMATKKTIVVDDMKSSNVEDRISPKVTIFLKKVHLSWVMLHYIFFVALCLQIMNTVTLSSTAAGYIFGQGFLILSAVMCLLDLKPQNDLDDRKSASHLEPLDFAVIHFLTEQRKSWEEVLTSILMSISSFQSQNSKLEFGVPKMLGPSRCFR